MLTPVPVEAKIGLWIVLLLLFFVSVLFPKLNLSFGKRQAVKLTMYYGPDHSRRLKGAKISAEISGNGDVRLPDMYVSNDGDQRVDRVSVDLFFSEPVIGAVKEELGYLGSSRFGLGSISPGGGYPIGGTVRFEGLPETVEVKAKTDYLFSPPIITAFTLILKPTPQS